MIEQAKTIYTLNNETPKYVYIEYEDKNYRIDKKDYLDRTMRACQISQEEAIELWLEENVIEPDEEYAELLNAPKAKIRGESSTKKERKKPTRKEDKTKKMLIDTIFNHLQQNVTEIENITIRNAEKYIDFELGGEEYTLNLVRHNKKK